MAITEPDASLNDVYHAGSFDFAEEAIELKAQIGLGIIAMLKSLLWVRLS